MSIAKPDGLLVVVEIGERDRGVAEAERNGAGVLDVLERAGQLLGPGLADGEGRGEREADATEMFHVLVPFQDDAGGMQAQIGLE